MSLKTWFLGAATIGRAAAARQADVPVDDFRETADDLGYGPRLTYHQIEEVIAALGDDEEDETDDVDHADDEEEDDDAEEEADESDEDEP